MHRRGLKRYSEKGRVSENLSSEYSVHRARTQKYWVHNLPWPPLMSSAQAYRNVSKPSRYRNKTDLYQQQAEEGITAQLDHKDRVQNRKIAQLNHIQSLLVQPVSARKVKASLRDISEDSVGRLRRRVQRALYRRRGSEEEEAYLLSLSCLDSPLSRRIRSKNRSVDSLVTPRSKSLRMNSTLSSASSSPLRRLIHSSRSTPASPNSPIDRSTKGAGVNPCVLNARLFRIEAVREIPQGTKSSDKQRKYGNRDEEVAQPNASLTRRCSSTPDFTTICWEELIKEYPKPKSIEHFTRHTYPKPPRRPRLTRRSATAGPLLVDEKTPSLKDGELHRMMRGSFSATNLGEPPICKNVQDYRDLDYARDRSRPVFWGPIHAMMYGLDEPGEDHRHLPKQPPTTPEEPVEPAALIDLPVTSSYTEPERVTEEQSSSCSRCPQADQILRDKSEDPTRILVETGAVDGDSCADHDVAGGNGSVGSKTLDLPQNIPDPSGRPLLSPTNNPSFSNNTSVILAASAKFKEILKSSDPHRNQCSMPSLSPLQDSLRRPESLDPLPPYRKDRRRGMMSAQIQAFTGFCRPDWCKQATIHRGSKMILSEPGDFLEACSKSRENLEKASDFLGVVDEKKQANCEQNARVARAEQLTSTAEGASSHSIPTKTVDQIEMAPEAFHRRRRESLAHQEMKNQNPRDHAPPPLTNETKEQLLSELCKVPTLDSRPRASSTASSQLSPKNTNDLRPDSGATDDFTDLRSTISQSLSDHTVYVQPKLDVEAARKTLSVVNPARILENYAFRSASQRRTFDPSNTSVSSPFKQAEAPDDATSNNPRLISENPPADIERRTSASAPQLTTPVPTRKSRSSESPSLVKYKKTYCVCTLSDGNEEIEQVDRTKKTALCLFGPEEDAVIPEKPEMSSFRATISSMRTQLRHPLSHMRKFCGHKDKAPEKHPGRSILKPASYHSISRSIDHDRCEAPSNTAINMTDHPMGSAARSVKRPKKVTKLGGPKVIEPQEILIQSDIDVYHQKAAEESLKVTKNHHESVIRALHFSEDPVKAIETLKRLKERHRKHQGSKKGRLVTDLNNEYEHGQYASTEDDSLKEDKPIPLLPKIEEEEEKLSRTASVKTAFTAIFHPPSTQRSSSMPLVTFSLGAPSPAEVSGGNTVSASPYTSSPISRAVSVPESKFSTAGGESPASDACSVKSSCVNLHEVSKTLSNHQDQSLLDGHSRAQPVTSRILSTERSDSGPSHQCSEKSSCADMNEVSETLSNQQEPTAARRSPTDSVASNSLVKHPSKAVTNLIVEVGESPILEDRQDAECSSQYPNDYEGKGYKKLHDANCQAKLQADGALGLKALPLKVKCEDGPEPSAPSKSLPTTDDLPPSYNSLNLENQSPIDREAHPPSTSAAASTIPHSGEILPGNAANTTHLPKNDKISFQQGRGNLVEVPANNNLDYYFPIHDSLAYRWWYNHWSYPADPFSSDPQRQGASTTPKDRFVNGFSEEGKGKGVCAADFERQETQRIYNLKESISAQIYPSKRVCGSTRTSGVRAMARSSDSTCRDPGMKRAMKELRELEKSVGRQAKKTNWLSKEWDR